MDETISITWSIDDVLSVRDDLTDEQAKKVLLQIKTEHDSNIGINWDVIEQTAERMFPETGEVESTPAPQEVQEDIAKMMQERGLLL